MQLSLWQKCYLFIPHSVSFLDCAHDDLNILFAKDEFYHVSYLAYIMTTIYFLVCLLNIPKHAMKLPHSTKLLTIFN